MLNWEDQIVVVTGGSGGIGRVIVETLAVMRVTVVVIDIIDFGVKSGSSRYSQPSRLESSTEEVCEQMTCITTNAISRAPQKSNRSLQGFSQRSDFPLRRFRPRADSMR